MLRVDVDYATRTCAEYKQEYTVLTLQHENLAFWGVLLRVSYFSLILQLDNL